ncbi:MAG: SpoIIE family protein phosphatase [Actinomycetota bacterium]|nr:SpoIIE family protein phosphatase [Actinomycetota bacterium]
MDSAAMDNRPGRDARSRRLLPSGTPLPDDVWLARHRALLAAAWVGCVAAFVWATATGGLSHGFVDASPTALAALVATLARPGSRRSRRESASCAVMLALMTAIAVAVHLSGGLIEAHFLFFIAISAAAAYQTWAPFLTAIGFVVLHHGVVGALAGELIFNHPAAQSRPWLWALIHGGLIAVASAVGIAAWRADELVRARLAALGARSGLIVSTVEDGIVAVDGEGRVIDANPAAARLLGGDEPVTGRPLRDLVRGVCDDDQMQEVLRGQRPSAGEHTHLVRREGSRGTGERTPVGVTVVPVQGDDSVRAVVTLRDLSTAARAETAERALVNLAERERAQRDDVAALLAAVRPRALTVDGLQLAVAYEPAASAPAGGDLYDWLVLPSGEVLIIVVDAMGRGTTATGEALAVTSTVRTLAVAGCPLEEVVARAGAVLAVTHPELLATLLVAAVDPATGYVRLAGGGHPPALVVTAEDAREVAAEGLGVGYPQTGSFATRELVLAPGETLLLYTDGLIEGTRDVSAGLRELAATAVDLALASPEEFATRLLTDVSTCALEADDCLAVVIRRPAAPATAACAEERLHPPVPRLTREVPAQLAEVSSARAAGAQWLRAHGVAAPVVDTCSLLVSELVTNAVRHAGTPSRLVLHRYPDEILIEVADRGAVLPVVRESDEEATGGRGMRLVAALSLRWGARRAGDVKTVWCTVPTEGQDDDEAILRAYGAIEAGWADDLLDPAPAP